MSSLPLPFAKMHGCGNDYVVVDARRESIPDPATLARAVCDRRRGIGSDGLLLVETSLRADVRMRMLNPDGSEAEMCGNGLRCLARYVRRLDPEPASAPLRVETGAGVLTVRVPPEPEDVDVDMGAPRLERHEIPMAGPAGRVVDEALAIDGETLHVTAVSMGNPHAVLFVDDTDLVPLATIGPRLETDARFPRRTNVEVVEVLARGEVRQRTWERGCGETEACGTGACAVVVAAVLTGRTDREVTVHLRGGDLHVRWDERDGHVYQRGPAVTVFEGRWPRS